MGIIFLQLEVEFVFRVCLSVCVKTPIFFLQYILPSMQLSDFFVVYPYIFEHSITFDIEGGPPVECYYLVVMMYFYVVP